MGASRTHRRRLCLLRLLKGVLWHTQARWVAAPTTWRASRRCRLLGMPSSAHRKRPTAHHKPTSAGLAALASFAATGEGILAVACPYFLESMPRGSPVQYHIACVTRQRILYGR